MKKLGLVLAPALLALGLAAPARALPPTGDGSGGVRLTSIGSFDSPVYVTHAPGRGNRRLVFVVEQAGRVMVVRNGVTLPAPFLDIDDLVQGSGERGLLSIAFHPNYVHNRALYAYFTDNAGDNRVVEFKRRRGSRVLANPGSARTVIVLPHPDETSNHNGGQISFGPDDLLYIAPGDGGSTPEAAQDRKSLRGKVLRIRPRRRRGRQRTHSNPRGNPFVGKPGLDEIYSLGLRNPFRFSFDARTGAMAIGDVGADDLEEVDFRKRGKGRGVNYGWPRFEGTVLHDSSISAPGAIGPIFQYSHSGGGCAIIGGFVVRDRRLKHQYARFLYSDNCDGTIRSLIPRQGGASDAQAIGGGASVSAPSSFGEDARRRLYVTSLAGPVYRLDPLP